MNNSKLKNLSVMHSLFFIFVVFSVFYYSVFAADISNITNYSDYNSSIIVNGVLFNRAVNVHDHFIYINYIELIENKSVLFSVNNNTGVAYFYYWVKRISGAGFQQLVLMSLLINLVVLYLAMISFCKVVSLLKLNSNYCLLFFLNGSLLYFSQLINKDSFTLFIFIKSIELVLSKSYRNFLWLIPFGFLIRIQLVPFLFLFLYLSSERKPVGRFWFAYLLTAIIAGLVAKYIPLIEFESMSSGAGLNINFLLMELNQKYVIASVFFNPIRVLQYFFSVFQSLNFVDASNALDIGKMKDLPQIFVLIVSLPFLIQTYCYYRRYIRLPSRLLMAQISAFFMIWLINPTTNGRYMLLMIPVISLLAAYSYEFKKGRIKC